MSKVSRPTTSQLKKVGVTILDSNSSFFLRCDQCGSVWSPNIQPGGHLPRDYWKCERGCNAQASAA
jgi:hypothetical protein